jgi:SIR2-like domain
MRDGSSAFPTWKEFLANGSARLAGEDAAACARMVEVDDFVGAAKLIRDGLSSGSWYRMLRRAFDPPIEKIDRTTLWVQRAIWSCSSGLIITTNYDRSLIWGAPNSVRDQLRIIGLDTGVSLEALRDESESGPVIWHLHGRIETPSSIVIAPDGYNELYGARSRARKAYAQTLFCLRNIIATHSLLFVGFSLADAHVVAELQRMHKLFDAADHSHYIVVHASEVSAIEERISRAGLSNIEMLEVNDFEASLAATLEALAANRRKDWQANHGGGESGSKLTFLRRRCRTLAVGSPDFLQAVLPRLAETLSSGSRTSDLVYALSVASSTLERTLVMSILYELEWTTDLMLEASDPTKFSGADWGSVALFHAIALEKEKRPEEALTLNKRIEADISFDKELRMCAAFNGEVCLEKLDKPVDFSKWMQDRECRLRTGELVWPKAFSMELVACIRRGEAFRFPHLLGVALEAEVRESSTGFAKTILNWACYTGERLDDETSAEVWRIASRASVSARMAMLDNLRTMTNDRALTSAIEGLFASPEMPVGKRSGKITGV